MSVSDRACSNEDCKQVNPQDADCFYKNSSSKQCISCLKEKRRKYEKKPEARLKIKIRKQGPGHKQWAKEYYKIYKDRGRNNKLLRVYGISLEQYNQMRITQNHKCKICEVDELNAGKKGLVIDHDHETGKIRGLLCGSCNRALGYFKDRLDILNKAVDYLSKKSESNVITFKKKVENL